MISADKNSRTELTNKKFRDLLAKAIAAMEKNHNARSDLVLASWPRVVGPTIAKMSVAISFKEAVLTVKVRNSLLYSLLRQKEKFWILRALRKKFPNVEINNIIFRIG